MFLIIKPKITFIFDRFGEGLAGWSGGQQDELARLGSRAPAFGVGWEA